MIVNKLSLGFRQNKQREDVTLDSSSFPNGNKINHMRFYQVLQTFVTIMTYIWCTTSHIAKMYKYNHTIWQYSTGLASICYTNQPSLFCLCNLPLSQCVPGEFLSLSCWLRVILARWDLHGDISKSTTSWWACRLATTFTQQSQPIEMQTKWRMTPAHMLHPAKTHIYPR